MNILRTIAIAGIALWMPLSLTAQSVTQPASMDEVASADDYATRSFQDPWDMDSQTDLGWFTYAIDLPFGTGSVPGFNNISFSGGTFSAVTATNDPAISVLDTGIVGTALLGKIGTNFPIDADTYTSFCIRMSLDSAGTGQLFWSKNTIYLPGGGYSGSGGFSTYGDWAIYCQDIPSLGVTAPTLAGTWSGDVDSLRFDPTTASAGETVEIDWIRLVDEDASLDRTISWTGSTSVDIYLDDDDSPANGDLGTIARGFSGSSFTYNVGSLPPGDYYVAVVGAGGNPGAGNYSSGFYRVNDLPTLKFTAPSDEGSSDDFATTQLTNPWDMDALTDIDREVNHSSLTVTTVNSVVDDAGNDIAPITALKGVNLPGSADTTPGTSIGDPYVYPLWWTDTASTEGRGAVYRIDSDKYRILVLRMGVPGNRDYANGSHARIVWKRVGEGTENVSEDVLLRSKAPTLVLNTIILDMETLDIDPASPAFTGWNGLIDAFRVDGHEFSDPTEYYIESVKLAAFERTNSSYTIEWIYTDNTSGFQSLDLYYDSDRSGFDGVLIDAGLDPTTGQYAWSSPPSGTHYIYAVYSDGKGNTNQTYALWPIVVDPSYTDKPNLVLDKSKLIFNGSSDRAHVTGTQKVRVDVDGAGTVDWTASSNRAWLSVSPPSGTDNGFLTLSIDPGSFPLGLWDGTITISSSDALNTPRYIRVFGDVTGISPPFGSFDTPADGASDITGNIAVTGWVLDDIETTDVKIYRDPIGGEGASLIFIGDAVFVEGSRPDIEAAVPGYPFNYRAGWGYMMLTNFLPNGGNGTFTIHAIATDKEGNDVTLGTKTITLDNANGTKPFGTIDTPTQGGSASGVFRNWGWVLTPQPDNIPTDGSTIFVFVDGAPLGILTDYGLARADIQSLFSGYQNTNTAVGYFDLDTAAYANGVHNIAWSATDSGADADGIGSRFFVIENGGSGSMEIAKDVPTRNAMLGGGSIDPFLPGRSGLARLAQVFSNFLGRGLKLSYWDASLASRSAFSFEPLPIPCTSCAAQKPRKQELDSKEKPSVGSVKIGRGYRSDAELTDVAPDEAGVIQIEMKELDRIEVHLPLATSGREFEGYHLVGDDRRPLPIGSSLDEEAGIFYWALSPGFLGDFDLLFRSREKEIGWEEIRVRIKVAPRYSGTPK